MGIDRPSSILTKLAIQGGIPVRQAAFPAWPQFDEDERNALQEVLESHNWWRTPGFQTRTFEASFANYQGAQHGIAVTNGTAALEVGLAALGIGPGDEVIVPDFTFVATAGAVLFTGALPVMVDVTPDTYCLDPDSLEAAMGPRTKAVIVVHMGGHPADLDHIAEITGRHRLHLIEDSAHAHGSEWKGRKVGAIGDLGTFSFQQSKLMTAGEGGIIITNNDGLADRVRSVHDCGRRPDAWFYDHFIYGSNYRLSEWQGAILNQQLRRLDQQAARRTKNAAFLDWKLADVEGITPQAMDPRCTRHGRYAYIFHYDAAAFGGVPTDRFIQALNAEGIPTQASYPPLHQLDLFTSGDYRKRLAAEHRNQEHTFLNDDFPNTRRAAWETVWLPNPVLLADEADMDQIVAALQKIQFAFRKQLF